MYIPEKMKFNKFKDVRIPSKGEYFNTGRFLQDKAVYGGEENPIKVTGTHKVDDLEELEKELANSEK